MPDTTEWNSYAAFRTNFESLGCSRLGNSVGLVLSASILEQVIQLPSIQTKSNSEFLQPLKIFDRDTVKYFNISKLSVILRLSNLPITCQNQWQWNPSSFHKPIWAKINFPSIFFGQWQISNQLQTQLFLSSHSTMGEEAAIIGSCNGQLVCCCW